MQYLKLIMSSLLLILIASCSLNDLSLPDWNTNLKIFLNTDQISMNEVLTEESLKDSLNTEIGDTLIYVSITDTTEPKAIEQSDLAFKADDDQIIEEIGDIELDDPDPRTTKPKTLPEIFPSLPIMVGQDVVIPDTTIPLTGFDVSFTSYQSVTIKNGRMFLVFHNDLTIDVDSGMVISVFDGIQKVGDFIFDQVIPQNSSLQSSDLSLSGRQLSNNFTLEYIIPLIGTGGQLRTITTQDTSSNFTTDVHIVDMDVTEAFAEIPEQNTIEEDASALDSEDKEIVSATINSGTVYLDITNNTEVASDIIITIKSIVDNQDRPLASSGTVYADSTTHIEIDLSDHIIKNSESPGAPLDSIRYIINATSIPTGEGNFVQIQSTDEIIVDVVMDSIFVKDFEGSIDNLEITIDPVEEEDLVDLTDLDGAFRLPDLNLVFKFYNEINFDISLNLIITGDKVENDVVTESLTLNIPANLNRGQTGNPSKTVITLNDQTSDPSIVDLMAIFPTRITVEGTGFVNGTGSVTLGDELWAEYSIESPLKIQIEEPLAIDTDLDSLTSDDLKKNTRKAITDDLNDVKINLDIENGLPFGTNLLFVMSLDSVNMFMQADDSNNIIIETSLDPGLIDNNGLVITPTIGNVQIDLSQEDVQIFDKKNNLGNYLPVYYGSRVLIDSSLTPIQFRKQDELRYDGYIEVKYKVSPDNE